MILPGQTLFYLHMKPAIGILSAGIGSRFGGLKQMKPVGPGRELLIDYSIFDARRAGFGKIVFIISRKIEEEFKAHINAHYGSREDFDYVFQELDDLPPGFRVPEGRSKPWGTTHAVLAARKALTVPFAVINADDFYGPSSFRVMYGALDAMAPGTTEYAMVGFELSKTLSEFGAVSRGVCSVENGYCTSVVECEKIAKSGDVITYSAAPGKQETLDPRSIVSMNFWGFAPDTLYPMLEREFGIFLEKHGSETKSECFLPTIIDRGLRRSEIRVRVLSSGEEWFGMTFAEDVEPVREYLMKKIEAGIYPRSLFA